VEARAPGFFRIVAFDSVMRRLQKVGTEERHDGDGVEVGGEKREHHAKGQRGEEVLAHTEEQRDRKENHDGHEHDRENGECDFVCALHRRDLRILAELDVTVDVFNHDYRIVDQSRERQRESAEHHAVDRLVGGMQDEKRDQHRERNRKKHRCRGPHAAEEKQNHHRREKKADAAFTQHRGDRFLHEQRLIEHHVRMHLRRNIA
jgi:hypothetical protein